MTTGFMSGSYKIISLLKQTYHSVCIQMQVVLQSVTLGKFSHVLVRTIFEFLIGNILLLQFLSHTYALTLF